MYRQCLVPQCQSGHLYHRDPDLSATTQSKTHSKSWRGDPVLAMVGQTWRRCARSRQSCSETHADAPLRANFKGHVLRNEALRLWVESSHGPRAWHPFRVLKNSTSGTVSIAS